MILRRFFCILILGSFVQGLRWTMPGNNCDLVFYEPCTSETDIKFEMISTEHLENKSILLDPYKPQIPLSYNLSQPLKIIIHGYGGKILDKTPDLINAYTAETSINILVVDWTQLSVLPCYPQALLNTWQVARCTTVLITSLTALGVKADSMHIIGFSLGAHVGGIIGQLYKKVLKTKIQRITGLDPALPLYATLSFDPEWILDAGDAYFVDIIHTNSGIYGKIANTGDVDFYINGGSFQPNCKNSTNKRLCNHLMAPRYFAESISSETGFWGTPCSSYFSYVFGHCRKPRIPAETKQILMGEYCSKTSRGVYFVNTAAQAPFALGKSTK